MLDRERWQAGKSVAQGGDGTERRPGTGRVRNASAELVAQATRLRERMTPAEEILWEAIRAKRLGGLRFRAQHPVETFILDFYCPSHRLVIEVDGSVHDSPDAIAHDRERDQYLIARGCTVLRFSNDEIMNHLPIVLQKIAQAAGIEAPPTPQYWGESEGEMAPRPPSLGEQVVPLPLILREEEEEPAIEKDTTQRTPPPPKSPPELGDGGPIPLPPPSIGGVGGPA